MSKPTFRKLLRRHGGRDKDGKPIPAGEVKPAEKVKVPMKFQGTQLLVSVVAGQHINPKKEWMRQLGINRKTLKKMRAKAKKKEVNYQDITKK